MTRPTRTLATLFALLGSAAVLTGTASAQTYQSPPAHHVPTTSYGSTLYEPVYAAPAHAVPVRSGTVPTQPYGGQVLYRPAPVPSSVSTQTYIAPASQAIVDDGVTYAPYYGTPQPQPVYRQPAPTPFPVYRAPQPVQTWVRPPQPVYAPAPTYDGPGFGAPAIIGGLFGAAILGAILLNDDDDRHRHRARDHRGDRHDGSRRNDRRDDDRRAARQQERAEQAREDRRADRRAERGQARADQAAIERQRDRARRDGARGVERMDRARADRRAERGQNQAEPTRAERRRLREERRENRRMLRGN